MHKVLKQMKMIKLLIFEPTCDYLKDRPCLSVRGGCVHSACYCFDISWMPLTKASLNCQKVGFVRSLTEDGRTARRVQAELKNNTNQHCQ